LGARFIAGGDYNSKRTHWGLRLITPKGRVLKKVISNTNAEIISTKKATYWPSDQNKIPDLLDFFVMKGISSNYIEIIEVVELTSDHIPVLLTLSSNAIIKQRKVSFTNKKTNWDLFRSNLDEMVTLSVRLRTPIEIDSAIKQLTNNVVRQ